MTAVQQPIGSGFSASSTTTDVLNGRDLSGQTVLVTGGASGLGLATTVALAGAGARVLVGVRRPAAAREALAGVSRVEIIPLDLADLASTGRLAKHLITTDTQLDLVVAAAGVMAVPQGEVGPGWEAHFATNHLGHFALINRLIPTLTPGRSRVVLFSSAGHFLSAIRWDDLHFRGGYDRWEAYGQSKTANALMATHLATLGRPSGITAFAVHPGSILTPLQRHIPRAEQVHLGWMDQHGRPAAGFKTPEQGAATAVWAATTPGLEPLSGAYCQDCDIAAPATTDDMLVGGVKPWAVDPDAAARLWELSADLTRHDGFLKGLRTRHRDDQAEP